MPVGVDVNSASVISGIRALQNKMKQAGLADFLDIDIPAGKIIGQIQLLKRLMSSAGLTDLLGFSLSRSQLEGQLSKLAGIEAKIPLTFDTSRLPAEIAKISKQQAETIPITFDVGKIPELGTGITSLTERVTANTSEATEAIAALQARIAMLARGLSVLRIGADDRDAEAKIAALQAKLAAIAKYTENIRLSADTGKLDAAIAAEQVKLAALTAKANNIDIYFNTADLAKLDAQIAAEQAKIAKLTAAAEDIRLGFRVDDASLASAEAKILALEATVSKLAIGVTFDVGKLPAGPGSTSLTEHVDTAAAQASLLALGKDFRQAADAARVFQGAQSGLDIGLIQASINTVRAASDLRNMGADLLQLDTALKDTAGITAELTAADTLLAGQSDRVSANFRSLAAAQGLGATAARALADATGGGGGGGGGGGLAGALAAASASFGGGKIAAIGWGGALTATIPVIGLAIKSVAAWHIVLDLIIEGLISLGLAAAAAAAGIAVMIPAAQDIKTHLQAVQNVNSALGSSIPPLTGQFSALAQAMAPQVIEAYGGALNLIANKTGGLGQIAAKVVTIFDDWIAKIDLFASNKNFNQFLTAGIGYLSQFASILGNVGAALTSLLSKDPGIAKFLLDIINFVAQALKGFAALPGPVVATVLALHGLYVWGSVLAPLLLKLVAYLLELGATFLTLAANPFTWVAAAVIGLAALAYQSTQATGAAKQLIAGLEGIVSNAPASQAILDIAQSVGVLSVQIQANTGPINAMKQWNAQSESLGGGFQRLSYNIRATGGAFGEAFKSLPESLSTWSALSHTVTSFGRAFADVFSSSSGASIAASNNVSAYTAEINKLIGEQGTLFRVAGSLITQGFTLAQSFALEDLAGVKAGDSFQLASQKVENLITGYKNMSVQGPILANSVNAVTFASLQQQSQISQLTSAWTAFISLVTGGVAGFTGFETQIYGIATAASSAATTLNVSSGKASLSLKGTGLAASGTAVSITGLSQSSLQLQSAFTQGITQGNTLINALTAQASASGLASQGTDMLTAATKDVIAQLIPFAGNSVAAQSELIALAQQGGFPAGASFQQLSKWVGTASGTMGAAKSPAGQLQGIMNTLAQTSSNLTTDVQNLSTALGTNLTQAEASAIELAKGGVAPFNNFASAVTHTGVSSDTTRQAAIKLGDEFLALSNNNVPAAKAQFESFAIGGLGVTKSAADQLWNDIIQHGIPSLGNLGTAATNVKNNSLAPLGVGVDTVTGKVQNLSKYLLAVPTSVNTQIHATASGSGQIAASENIPGFTGTPAAILAFHAAGGQIRGSGGPTQDNIPIMASVGEYVINAASAAKIGTPALNKLNRYAAGGSVSGSIGNVFAPEQYQAKTSSDYEKNTEVTWMNQVAAQFKAQVAKTAAARAAAIASAAKAGAGGVANGATITAALKSLGVTGAELSAALQVIAMESGGSLTATNPSSGAYGIAQFINGPSEYYTYGGNPNTVAGQITAFNNYVRQRYGTYQAALAHENAFHWYGKGGLIPGMAAGGTVAGLRATLAAEQAGERAHYFGFEHSYAIGPAKYRTARTMKDLATLAKNQGYETRAYAALAGSGLTTSNLRWLGSQARDVLSTTNDVNLSKAASAGGHPVWRADLRKYLSQIIATSGGTVPGAVSTGGKTGGGGTGPPTIQGGGGGTSGGTTGTSGGNTGGGTSGGTASTGTVSTVSSALATEIPILTAAFNVFLRDINAFMADMGSLAPGGAGTGATAAAGSLPRIEMVYGGTGGVLPADVNAILGDLRAAALPGMAAGGPVRSYDKGGWLPPGMSTAWNGTGRPEPVGAAGQKIDVTISFDASVSAALTPQMLRAIKYEVRTRGGGSVQKAFGNHEITNLCDTISV